MTSIPQTLRYLPHTLETRYHAVKTEPLSPSSVNDTRPRKHRSCAGTSDLTAQKNH